MHATRHTPYGARHRVQLDIRPRQEWEEGPAGEDGQHETETLYEEEVDGAHQAE